MELLLVPATETVHNNPSVSANVAKLVNSLIGTAFGTCLACRSRLGSATHDDDDVGSNLYRGLRGVRFGDATWPVLTESRHKSSISTREFANEVNQSALVDKGTCKLLINFP